MLLRETVVISMLAVLLSVFGKTEATAKINPVNSLKGE
jgi:hypothetical protein